MRIALGILILAVIGCTPEPVIYHCPVIHLPPDPVFPTKLLKDGAKPNDVVKSYYADDVAARAALKAVRVQIESVNKANGGVVQQGK